MGKKIASYFDPITKKRVDVELDTLKILIMSGHQEAEEATPGSTGRSNVFQPSPRFGESSKPTAPTTQNVSTKPTSSSGKK
jgi:hypothetical protein